MFKPMLAPNDKVDLNEVKYPIFASYKLDGIRCIFKNGEILSRSLKPIVNKQLRDKLQPLAEYSKEHNIILDGEIYSPELTFQEITRFVMTQDFEDAKSIKKHGEVLTIPSHLKYYIFDCIKSEDFDLEFIKREEFTDKVICDLPNDIIEEVEQVVVMSNNDVEELFSVALEEGFEGLILKDIEGRYKCGRGTIREGLIYKVKPFETFDTVITDVVQSTEVDPNAERKTNELGRSVTSKKKDDRILIQKASGFWVEYNGNPLKVMLAMTDVEKEQVWKNKESYIGKVIEYKGMLIGAKDVPRHPVFVRFRNDKD